MNFASFIGQLLKSKLLFLVTALIVFAIAATAIYIPTFKSTVTAQVAQLPTAANLDFAALNTQTRALGKLAGLNEPVKTVERTPYGIGQIEEPLDSDIDFYVVDNRSMFTTMVQTLRQKRFFADEIRNSVIVRKPDESDIDYNERLNDFLSKIEVLAPKYTRGRVVREYWSVQIKSEHPEKVKTAIFNTLAKANAEVKAKFTKRIQSLIAQMQQHRDFRIADLDKAIENEIEKHDDQLKFQLSNLKEQAKIARALNIASNTIETIPLSNNATVITESTISRPLFLRGYKALEREIELISNRANKKDYVLATIELKQERRTLDSDQSVERLKQELERVPLGNETFQVTYFDPTAADITAGPSKIILLILSAIISVGLAFAFVCLWIFYRHFTRNGTFENNA